MCKYRCVRCVAATKIDTADEYGHPLGRRTSSVGVIRFLKAINQNASTKSVRLDRIVMTGHEAVALLDHGVFEKLELLSPLYWEQPTCDISQLVESLNRNKNTNTGRGRILYRSWKDCPRGLNSKNWR